MDKKEILSVIKRGDIFLVAALAIVSLVLMLSALIGSEKTPERAVVSQNGDIVAVLDLEKDAVLQVGEGEHTNTVVVKDGKVRVETASCPDGLCVSCGEISKSGELILCLPNRMVVRIESDSGEGSDTVSY